MVFWVFGLLDFPEPPLGFGALLVLFCVLDFDPDFWADPLAAFLVPLDGVAPLAGEAGVWAADVSATGAEVVAAGCGLGVLGVLGALLLGVLATLDDLALLEEGALDLLAFCD